MSAAIEPMLYDRFVVEQVWGLAQPVPGNDPALWRKDEHGAWMHRLEYRNRRSQFGWEIVDLAYSMRRAGVETLRPMHWENYLDFMVAERRRSVITADGLSNARRLI
jgi:hypothetical protein